MRKRLILLFMITVIVLSACEGATSGSVRNSSQTCHNLGGYGDCEGRIGRLTGTYTIDIEDEGISPGDDVVVELSLSIDVGSVIASMQDRDGQETSVLVEPGISGNLIGVVGGDFDGFEVVFHSPGEAAEGIDYALRYFIE